jgi:hypothetical protein
VLNHTGYQMPIHEVQDQLIDELTILFNRFGRSINDFNLPKKSSNSGSSHMNHFIEEELCYDNHVLLSESEALLR